MRCFERLGLPDTATPEEVKTAFRALASLHHPDHGGDPAEFVLLKKAYDQALAIAEEPQPCPACKGAGRVMITRGFTVTTVHCPKCSQETK